MAGDDAKTKTTAGKGGGGNPGVGGAGVSAGAKNMPGQAGGASSGSGGAAVGNEMGAGAGGANDRRMAQNLEAARGGLQQAAEQSSPSFQAASAVGSAIGVGGSAKSDEEYSWLDALWDVVVVSIMLWWGEGVAPLSSWLMEGMSLKNIKRFLVFAMIVTLLIALVFLFFGLISSLAWAIINKISLGLFKK